VALPLIRDDDIVQRLRDEVRRLGETARAFRGEAAPADPSKASPDRRAQLLRAAELLLEAAEHIQGGLAGIGPLS